MTRRQLLLLSVAGVVIIAVMAAVAWRLSVHPATSPQHTTSPQPPDQPFTDLETALAPKAKHGWELHIPPRHPGPYRLLPGGSMLGRSESQAMTGIERDKNGTVVRKLRLEGNPEYDQAIVYLETSDGSRTLAALKRVR